MNFGRYPKNIALDKHISLELKGFLSIIYTLCGSKDYCFPSIEYLCEKSGKSRSTVNRYIKELKLLGIITRNNKIIKINYQNE